MTAEQRTCQNCKKDFNIEQEDFDFYKKISVPPPTFCPQCRRQRRRAWRNDFNFYKRTCDLCKKNIVALYAPGSPMPVYCQKCWWSDKWDPKTYARDFDFSRPFFEQFRELQNVMPQIGMMNDNDIASVNCEYTQDVAFAKNCYMVMISWKVENCGYSCSVADCKEIYDGFSIFDNSEFVYDSIFVEKCYQCRYCYYSMSLSDCSFCYDCRGSSDCFMSIGLRNKKYCFQNKQYSKEEYERILAGYRLDTWSGVQKAKAEFREFLLRYPHKFANLRNSVNCIGDDLVHCKNMKYCFNVEKSEDCRYFENGDGPKDGYDMTVAGENNQCYEGITPDHSYRGLFTMYSWKNSEITYCENCHASKYLFGCAGLKKGEFCIFNKQYPQEEYWDLRGKIIAHMQKTGEWGEFFPSNLSNFGYNESTAQDVFPLDKGEALRAGFKWQDNLQFTTGKETIKPEDLPDAIGDVGDDIQKQVLACTACGRNYLIVPQELQFYRKMGIPLPRQCFYCRHRERAAFRNPYELWERGCNCDGAQSANSIYVNTAKHIHEQGACPNRFMSAYAPERPEIVYCEACYQAEVI